MTGNRLSKTVDAVTEMYTYAMDNNRLLQTVDGVIKNYSYDQNGNILSNTDYEFVYGDSNRLQEVKENNATIATYTYNGYGERTKKKSIDDTFYFYNQSGQLIAELDGTGTTVREYIYLGGEPLALIDSTGINYYHNDHIGTPQAITDQSQATVWKADYTPFGEANITIETIVNNLRGIGQYFDAETDDNYNHWRYLELDLGRYRTSDRIGLGGGLNTYAYVGGNPINRVDPKGLYNIPSLKAFDPVTSLLTSHYVLGGGATIVLPGWGCGRYLSDTNISKCLSRAKKRINERVKTLSGTLKQGDIVNFEFESTKENYVTSIHAFGGGFDRVYVSCRVEGSCGSCARAKCSISVTRNDSYKDPIDLHQDDKVGASAWSPEANPYGTPFAFGIGCNQSYSTKQCQ